MSDFNDAAYIDYVERVRDVNSKQTVDMPWKFGGDDDPNYCGIFFSPKGWSFRVTINRDQNDCMLWVSKSAVNLSGEANSGGSIVLAEDGQSNSYPIASLPLKSDNSNKGAIFEEFAKRMKRFDGNLGERSSHYRHVGVSFENVEGLHHNVNQAFYGNGHDVFFNLKGYAAHVLNKETGTATKHLSVYRDRKGEHFLPVRFRDDVVKDGISSVSKELHDGRGNYLDARVAIDEDRRAGDEAAWEQKNLYQQPGFAFHCKSFLPRVFNYVHSRMDMVVPTALVVGATYAKDPDSGFKIAAAVTAYHAVVHGLAEETYDDLKGMFGRVRARLFGNGKRVYGEDNSQQYLKGYGNLLFGRHNLHKFTPHADPEVCKAGDNVCIGFEDVLRLNKYVSAKMEDDLRGDSLEEFLLTMHQLNLPITEYWVDKYTRLFECDNGVYGVFHENPKREITIYAWDSDALCANDKLRAPEEYQGQFNGSMICIEASRNTKDNDIEISQIRRGLSGLDVVNEIDEDILFRYQPGMDVYTQERSRKSVMELIMPHTSPRAAVYETDEDIAKSRRRFGLVTLPFAEAIMPVVQERPQKGGGCDKADNVPMDFG
ncbi:MAG: hypothetical protein ACRBDL_01455 [Alphaproteobacteria bacterium]